MKKLIPFSSGTEAENWHNNNCDICTTKCHNKRNLELGFITGDITIKTAEFIGYKQSNDNYCNLNYVCNNKDKYKPVKHEKIDNQQLNLF
jgi:hypothetical protein